MEQLFTLHVSENIFFASMYPLYLYRELLASKMIPRSIDRYSNTIVRKNKSLLRDEAETEKGGDGVLFVFQECM